MDKTYVKFKCLDAPYRFLRYLVYNTEYRLNASPLDNEIYFELTTEDETLVKAIQANQDKEIVVESCRGNKVTQYTLRNYIVKNVIVTKELCNKPYVFEIKISGKGIKHISYKDIANEFKNEKENKDMRSINEIFEESRRIEAGILTPKIENIYANKEKRTIVIKWQDNTSTKVTCNEKDTWDIEKGIAMAVAKKALGNNWNAYTILNKYIESVKYAQPTLQEKTPKKTRKSE